jgi:hypothetical protein
MLPLLMLRLLMLRLPTDQSVEFPKNKIPHRKLCAVFFCGQGSYGISSEQSMGLPPIKVALLGPQEDFWRIEIGRKPPPENSTEPVSGG